MRPSRFSFEKSSLLNLEGERSASLKGILWIACEREPSPFSLSLSLPSHALSDFQE